ATLATNGDDFDLTGSVVISNNPVGLIGASQCPNIPIEYKYCDHICEMLPPVRIWGQEYHSVPFATRVGGDTYLVIGSKPSQTVYRNNQVYCVLTNKYQAYFRPDISEPSHWTSNAPFMLVQYINSSTWES